MDTWKVVTDGSKEPKSRLAVRGDQEEKNLLKEKFAPTASKAASNFVLCIIKSHIWEPVTIDIKKLFLHSQRMKRDVSVQPQVEAQIPKTHCWKLLVAVYGLSDAALEWYQTLMN